MEHDYTSKLSTQRMRTSTVKRSIKVEDFYSDRSRIIFSSSFRRLQQKAQVFSLEPNSSVRTRLTHSIEVSDLGKTLANIIGQKLFSQNYISLREIPMIVAIVENACLLHDLGNPPFGHFGESAIQKWASDNLETLAGIAGINIDDAFKLLISDFLEFDGNPQGFRIITKLHFEQDPFSLNLTYATLLCALKYSRAAGEPQGFGILKKAGYFISEKDIVTKIYSDMNMPLHTRYPLTYIMEAADDIAYCLSDISDGIEKRIITAEDFSNEFHSIWKENYGNTTCPVDIPNRITNFGMDISVKWSKKIMAEASDNYLVNHESFFTGKADQLIPMDGTYRVLETIKQVSRKVLYNSPKAENIELTGYAVITGLLNHFSALLKLEYDDFTSIIKGIKPKSKNKLELESRLFHRLGNRYVRSYEYEINKLKTEDRNFLVKEWWLRAHLIVDHISGMTDDFALDTYQMLAGINLLTY